MALNLSPQEAYAMIENGDAYGVDVRESNEWLVGRAPNVSWNPTSNFNVESLPADKPLIFICRSGNRSGQVCTTLAPIRTDTYNLVGGMQAWQAAGLPMVSDTGNPRVA